MQNLNSKLQIGDGWIAKTSKATSGNTMQLGNKSGYPNANRDQISLFGIEDFYGNVWQFVDGFITNNNTYKYCNDENEIGNYDNYIDTNENIIIVGSSSATLSKIINSENKNM